MEQLYINGNIHTLNNNEVVEAMHIKDGLINDLGSTYQLMERYPSAQMYDLCYKTIIPGFTDSHMHLIRPQFIDLNQARSIDSLIQICNDSIEELEEDEWIVGRGWNHDYFDEPTIPTRNDLDNISITHPICLIRTCGHIATINSKALELLEITKDNIPIIDGGEIYVDENGEPTGIASEFALKWIYKNFKKPSLEKIKEIILIETNKLVREGILAVHSDDFKAFTNVEYQTIIQAYTELANENKLPIRIYQQCLLSEYSDLKNFIDAGYHTGFGNDFYRIGPLKLLLDGSLGARTAWMSKPYHDQNNNYGIATYSIEELNKMITYAHKNKMQLAVHGIGDQAIKTIINEYSKIDNIADYRHGVVHVQITEPNDLVQMAKLQILAYVQPIFLQYDTKIVEQRVGRELALTSYAFNTMNKLKIPTSFGTDSPVEPTNPFNNLYSAITRKNLDDTSMDSWNKDECLDIHTALNNYCYQGAYASFQENVKGTLEKNKFADFIVLSEDIFTIPSINIKNVYTIASVVNGEIKYQNKCY